MAERHIRGYAIMGALAYIDANYDEATRRRIHDALPTDLRAAMGSHKRVEYYPIEQFSALLRQIALSQKDEPSAIDAVAECGSNIAREATNTFLKLLMRVLTPVMFAKKLEGIWARDHDFGTVTCDTTRANENLIRIRIQNVDGYDFIGPLSLGYIRFAMMTMGKTDLKIDMKGWSLAAPGPPAIDYTLTWT